MATTAPAERAQASFVLVGAESSGKSTLARRLTGAPAAAANLRGTTVSVARYAGPLGMVLDTPGLVLEADSDAMRRALAALEGEERVVAVVRATSLDEDLGLVLPFVAGRAGAVVITHRDRAPDAATPDAVRRLGDELGVPVVLIDARNVAEADRDVLDDALASPGTFADAPSWTRTGWEVRQRRGPLEHPVVLALAAVALLLAPATLAVWSANRLAGIVEGPVDEVLAPVLSWLEGLPAPLSTMLAGDYGVVAMLPFLIVWAFPTVVAFALLIGVLKASGLLEVICAGLHPLVRPLGLHGRDLAPFVMGYGCNVPAVIATRACSMCTRRQAVGAIAFGSACSYQLGASGAVFAAAGYGWLVAPFVLFLLVTTVIYTALTRRGPVPRVIDPGARRVFVVRPALSAVRREAMGTIRQFVMRAMPIFIALCLVASLLQATGALDAVASALSPLMGLLALPGEASLGVVLASIRKDGILMFGEEHVAAALAPIQLVTAVYLAGVLLPCLTTSLTIARELSVRQAVALMGRQAAFAVLFTLVLAWGGHAVLAMASA